MRTYLNSRKDFGNYSKKGKNTVKFLGIINKLNIHKKNNI